MWNIQANQDEPGFVGEPSRMVQIVAADPANGAFLVKAFPPGVKYASVGTGFFKMADAFAAALEGYRTTGITHEVFGFDGLNVTEPARQAYFRQMSQ